MAGGHLSCQTQGTCVVKLFYDLFRSLFARLAILLVVATALILIEANNQNQAFIDKEEKRITDRIARVDKSIRTKMNSRDNKINEKNRLAGQISRKTNDINVINRRLDKSRRAKIGNKNKLNPVEFVNNVHNLAKRNIERAGLSITYSQTMFVIVDINKQIADKTLEKTRLNSQLIIVQSSNFLDLILRQDSPTDLLTRNDRILLFTLFYAIFFGPLTLKLINFFMVAPLARKTNPITITEDRKDQTRAIQYEPPKKEFKLQLDKEDSLIVRPGWYSLNTEGTTRTRFFWDQKNPFSSYAMGLVNMTEFKPDKEHDREIRLASEADPNRDIIPFQLKDHPGYIVKHGHVVATSGDGLAMKKVWGLWDWRNWLFGNLRYVFFTGTGTVYIHGYGTVSTNDTDNPNNRIKERHLIGYDTRTSFRMIRTETFVNYWLNDMPLYDIQFLGQGNYLQQQSFGSRDEKIFRSVLEDILGAFGKVLGF
jgi:uncharacterized protein (AIM24 family)